jgi:DNA polymerase-3 subunit gamma/tau
MNRIVSQALARKWRPRDFDSLVGQTHVVKALSHALDKQRLHHAYLFTGTRGVGKTTIARILARAVNCELGISRTPCGKCQACLEISQGRFVDLLEVDAATNTRVDEMRALLENAMYAPTSGRYKVYVIDEVHMLSSSAFNAMLKTLEEPPDHVLFILATTDPQKIPATVLSRCLQFALRQLPPDQIVDHLAYILGEEQLAFEQGALRLIAKAARGSVRDALSLTDQAIAYSAGHITEEAVRTMLGAVDQQVVHQILQALAQNNAQALLELSNSLNLISAPYGAILDELAALACKLSVAHFGGVIDVNDPDQAVLKDLQGLLGAEDLQLIYQIATHARAELHLAPEDSIGFSMALMRMFAFKPIGPGDSVLPPSSLNKVPIPDSKNPDIQTVRVELPTAANWPIVSQEVPATGLTRQALVQAEWVQANREAGVLQITLRTAIKAYTELNMVTRLEAALGQYYGCSVRLQMQWGEVQQTAHVVQSETRKHALHEAKLGLQEDPFLKDIQNLMGATVVSGSERTLSQTGPADI